MDKYLYFIKIRFVNESMVCDRVYIPERQTHEAVETVFA